MIHVNMKAIKAKARSIGVKPGRMRKAELIRAIQQAENNTPCYEPGTPECPQMDCCWRADCVTGKK